MRFASSLSSTVAIFALFYALEKSSNPAITISPAATYPLITFFILFLLGRDRWEERKAWAILSIIAGVALLQNLSPF